MSDALELQGLRALVTGGTKGVGKAVVALLCRAGANVVTTRVRVPTTLPKDGLSERTSRRPRAVKPLSTPCSNGSAASI